MEASSDHVLWRRAIALAVLGVIVIATGSWISWTIPGTSVPQSGQTLAVVLVGAFLGSRLSAGTLSLYLLSGAVGIPVFADGASGWSHLVGPTAGYLLGFLVAAILVGSASDRGTLARPGPTLGVMIAAHAVILLLGWLRLSVQLGVTEAFAVGVEPFIWGGVVKGALAAGVVLIAMRLAGERRGSVVELRGSGAEKASVDSSTSNHEADA